jgi:hypothetical protein
MHVMKPAPESVNLNVKRLFLAVAGLFLMAVPLAAPQAAPQTSSDPMAAAGHVQLHYTVFLGGLHVMNSNADFRRKGASYSIEMKAATHGLLRRLAPWNADLTSTGRMQKDQVRPTSGKITTTWQDNSKNVSFTYPGTKTVQVKFEPPQGEDKHEAVPESLKRDVLDPLNGIVQIMANFAYGKGCEQTVPVYDGHRRFDILLTDEGRQKLEGEDYSVFSGEAMKCKADLAMVAGSRKDREGSGFWEDNKGGNRPPVYIYLATVNPKLPPLPVRAETSTVFGNVVIHLKQVGG